MLVSEDLRDPSFGTNTLLTLCVRVCAKRAYVLMSADACVCMLARQDQ